VTHKNPQVNREKIKPNNRFPLEATNAREGIKTGEVFAMVEKL